MQIVADLCESHAVFNGAKPIVVLALDKLPRRNALSARGRNVWPAVTREIPLPAL
jgi:hypothetical protein